MGSKRLKRGSAQLEVAVPSLARSHQRAGPEGAMDTVVAGMDSHKRSATIEVMADDEAVLGRAGTELMRPATGRYCGRCGTGRSGPGHPAYEHPSRRRPRHRGEPLVNAICPGTSTRIWVAGLGLSRRPSVPPHWRSGKRTPPCSPSGSRRPLPGCRAGRSSSWAASCSPWSGTRPEATGNQFRLAMFRSLAAGKQCHDFFYRATMYS
jgi:hypothetical protein